MNHLTSNVNTVRSDLLTSPPKQTVHSLLTTLNNFQLTGYKIGVWLSYLLAYMYQTILTEDKTVYFFPLALSFVAYIEWMHYCNNSLQPIAFRQTESFVFLFATLTQALALTFWGFEETEFGLAQFLMVHISFVFYVLARNGWLTQGRLGILVWYDALTGFVFLPFRHFLLRLTTLFYQPVQTVKKWKKHRLNQLQTVGVLTISISLSFVLVGFVGGQLSQVSSTFSAVTHDFNQAFVNILQSLNQVNISTIFWRWILSLPVGAWLFGLVAGSLLSTPRKRLNYAIFQAHLRPFRVFPPLAAYIIIGSLCLMYGLFFVVSISEIGNLLSLQTISPQEASLTAVSGFWQLVRVSLLNFVVLGGFYLVGEQPLWEATITRWMISCLFTFAGLFALLASWKLFAIYIFMYGPTPLRLLSGWFILVLLVWCGLALIRFFRPIQAIRYGLLYAFVSFTVTVYIYALVL
ncbi:DUF4173 domain-containing protein [Streptococcus suis]|uniref:DUF4173 domain-containing protein n=1 Tax=Streptococcus parasuis TaxID=1501662 RepID=A0ABV2EST7_9STRE|nr:DUF4153 domain-containing protein [Streptococcus parasuis]MDG4514038.1 DUF4173 domain-containing protein [Streptococcus suis]BCP58921.1 lantibiotic ABC transporter permease [Streptococcus parasuis]BCP61053.1 lantibiotic ABC transporter permease [Streptococcus parasuis]GIC28840.1 lantibiotic ABC transporter permease [Streptococcus parasuis]